MPVSRVASRKRHLVMHTCVAIVVLGLAAPLGLDVSAAGVNADVRLDADRSRLHSFETSAHQWNLRWNHWTDAVRSGVASGTVMRGWVDADVAAAAARAFLTRHAVALGTEGLQLQQVRLRRSGETWLVTWVQQHQGMPVRGAFLDVTLRRDGQVLAFRSHLRPGLQVQPGSGDADRSHRVALKALGAGVRIESSLACVVVDRLGLRGQEADELVLSNAHGGRWRLRVSRVDGSVLEKHDLVRTQSVTGSMSGRISPRYFRDAQVPVQLPWLQIFQSEDTEGPSAITDLQGDFVLPASPGAHTLHADLAGLYCRVTNQAGDPAPHMTYEVVSPAHIDLEFNAPFSRPDERTIYYHTNAVHDLFKTRFGFDLLDWSMPAIAAAADPNTGDPNFPNAYWNGVQMGFGNGGGTFFNLGYHVDVIYHEYTHAVTDYIYRPVGGLNFNIGAAMHEGLSDYFSATFTDDPLMGDELLRDRTPYLRRIDDLWVYPDHMDTSVRPDVHRNGLILAGSLWDLRQDVGAAVADRLAHHACELFPMNYEEYFEAVVLQDDVLFGDGIPGNGSPHYDSILLAFARHGIGTLGGGRLAILHAPLGDEEDPEAARTVQANLEVLHATGQRAMRLLWSNGGAFQGVWMDEQPDGSFIGTIPPQPEGTTVQYYLTALQLPPVVTAVLPQGAPQNVYEYTVGLDEEPPQITHVPGNTHAGFTGAPQIQATLQDNTGIEHAWFEYRLEDGTEGVAGLVRPDPYDDVFRGRLPIALPVGSTVQYRIHARDASALQHRAVSPTQGWYELSVVDELQLGFEAHHGGFRSRALLIDRADGWMVSHLANHTPGGGYAWLGRTADAAERTVAAVLETPEYHLQETAVASIWSWIAATDNERGAVDAGQVQIQVDGGTWEVLTPEGGYSHVIDPLLLTNYLEPGQPCLSGRDDSWQQLHFDLAAYEGRRVRLRFLLGGAGPHSQQASEWFLDDFHLVAGDVHPTDVDVPGLRARLLQQPPSPNPFNPHVSFVLEANQELGSVRLDILDAQGRRVRRLVDGPLPRGTTRLTWDGSNARGLASASGVYYYLLESGVGRQTGKLVLVR